MDKSKSDQSLLENSEISRAANNTLKKSATLVKNKTKKLKLTDIDKYFTWGADSDINLKIRTVTCSESSQLVKEKNFIVL